MPDENDAEAQKLIAAAKAEAEDARSAAKAAKAAATESVAASAAANLAAGNAAASAAKQPLPLILTATLTGLCMCGAFYIGYQLLHTASLSTVTESTRRLQISALVCFLGMAFACLGFGLFLIGATGAFKGSTTGKSAISVDTAAPGLVVMVCATIVIYLALDVVKPHEPSPALPSVAGATTAPPPAAGAPVAQAAGASSGSGSASAPDPASNAGSGSAAKPPGVGSAGQGSGSATGPTPPSEPAAPR